MHPSHVKMPYRPCVGIILFSQKRTNVFWGKRNDESLELKNERLHLWQFPQGGIDPGESALQAAERELFEETNIRSVALLGTFPYWLHYDLPKEAIGLALEGKYRGQTQKWFAFHFLGNDDEINVTSPGDGKFDTEFNVWRWVDLGTPLQEVAPFKRAVYEHVTRDFIRFLKQP